MATRPWSEKIWFSPCYIINELASGVANGDAQKIKRLKEAWICAVGIICRSKVETGEWWIQLPKVDPPDVLAMRLIPRSDGIGQSLSELKVEVFEISEHDSETLEKSIERKLRGKDYAGMVVIGFVRRRGIFDHEYVASRIQSLNPKAGSVSIIVFEENASTNVSFIQLFPEAMKFKADFGTFCKTTSQRDFVEMRRGTKIEKADGTTTDVLTMVP